MKYAPTEYKRARGIRSEIKECPICKGLYYTDVCEKCYIKNEEFDRDLKKILK